MTTTVLVPLDGSDKDERALSIATALAHLVDGAVHLVRVVDVAIDPPDPVPPHPGPGLRVAAERLQSAVHRPVTWEMAEGFDVAEVLLRRANDLNAGLLVMATRAAGALGRAVHGSVADRVVREASRPVVLVPPGAEFVGGKRMQMQRVLVPLDGSPAALNALEQLMAFPRANELEIVLLEVVAPPPRSDHTNAEQAEERLDAVADRVRARGAVADVRVVEADDPAGVIVGAVRQELIDFVAMTTRGASGLERLVLGSVATEVVRRSEVSVLLVRPA
jgi:nucleotide-binding universal stress UspA family protein